MSHEPSREGRRGPATSSPGSPNSAMYGPDLAHVHHAAYGDLARRTAPVVLRWLREAGFDSGTIVDLGCGSGILAGALVEAGYDVLGFDISPAMIELARHAAPGARFEVGSCYDVEFPSSVAILAMGETLTYFSPDDPGPRLPSLFRRASTALQPGGILLFEIIHPSEAAPMSYRRTSGGTDWNVEVEVDEDLESRILTRTIRIRRIADSRVHESTELHTIRIHDPLLVSQQLAEAGFEVRRWAGELPIPLAPRRTGFLGRRSPT